MNPPLSINILAHGVSVPTTTRPLYRILESENARVQQQLAGLSVPFRERLMSQLGLEDIACEDGSCSRERAYEAVDQALARANVDGRHIGLIIDCSTYAVDAPKLWSLGHDVQHHIQAVNALVLGVHGSGCCGLHLALRTAQAFLHSAAQPSIALLIASDRAPDGGRVCLPISVMADAASALVVAHPDNPLPPIARVHAVQVQCDGRFVDVLTSASGPPTIFIDASRFEQQLVPVHFVVLNRVLSRALEASQLSKAEVGALVYPNTTSLDRQSAGRALSFDLDSLAGPGPAHLGHAFSNDLIINAQELLESTPARARYSAWLAAGSGFTWGAAIVESI